MNTQNKSYEETENDIRAVLLNRLSFENCEKFKNSVLYLNNKFNVQISREYLKLLVKNEQSKTKTENRIYQLIKRTDAKTQDKKRIYSVYVFGYPAVKTRETLSFLNY